MGVLTQLFSGEALGQIRNLPVERHERKRIFFPANASGCAFVEARPSPG
jgi:hypothetical protein